MDNINILSISIILYTGVLDIKTPSQANYFGDRLYKILKSQVVKFNRMVEFNEQSIADLHYLMKLILFYTTYINKVTDQPILDNNQVNHLLSLVDDRLLTQILKYNIKLYLEYQKALRMLGEE